MEKYKSPTLATNITCSISIESSCRPDKQHISHKPPNGIKYEKSGEKCTSAINYEIRIEYAPQNDDFFYQNRCHLVRNVGPSL